MPAPPSNPSISTRFDIQHQLQRKGQRKSLHGDKPYNFAVRQKVAILDSWFSRPALLPERSKSLLS